MELTKKEILSKTHYGLNIFAHILKKYYPDHVVLYVSGRKCKITKNPFNGNKLTLQIEVIDCVATYRDTEAAIPDGNVFDFAELHYKKENGDLLHAIAVDLNLIPKQKNSIVEFDECIEDPEHFGNTNPSTANFSYYEKPISNTKPLMTTNLYNIYQCIRHINYKEETLRLRTIKDPKRGRKFKANNFNYVTFSGTFSKRNDKNLLKHSGLITIDFDHINDIDELRYKLVHDTYFETELIFVSPSGDGLKWVIPINILEHSHQTYFEAISNYVKQTYKIEIDNSGKDVSRACFLPYDQGVYINPKYLRKI